MTEDISLGCSRPTAGLIQPGDRISVSPGTTIGPMVLTGLRGTRERPIVIGCTTKKRKSEASLTGEMKEADARTFLNAAAQHREQSGFYPAPGYLSDLAVLTLRNCQYVRIENARFIDCWPTALYLDECQHIAVVDCDFEGATLAIGANGRTTRDILVERCSFVQDRSRCHKLWNSIPWSRVHGAMNNTPGHPVHLTRDSRHFDGDFFRAWDIVGNVTIRDNDIRDAFNAIHFFNSVDALPPGVDANALEFNNGRRSASNVLIENNRFTRIRDNIVEPEDYAWNWVVRHNKLLDCYRPFSLELIRGGFIYIYGNQGAWHTRPSTSVCPEDQASIGIDKLRRTYSLFKPNKKQANEGPIAVFNNSWHWSTKMKGLFPKRVIGKLMHANNVVYLEGDALDEDGSKIFGRNELGRPGWIGALHSTLFGGAAEAEEKRFTRRWTRFGIRFDGDTINHPAFPEQLRAAGYALDSASKNLAASFPRLDPETQTAEHLDLEAGNAAAVMDGTPLSIDVPAGDPAKLPSTFLRGAVQPDGAWDEFDANFRFLPDTSWAYTTPKAERQERTATDNPVA